jgi:hypothetical protein
MKNLITLLILVLSLSPAQKSHPTESGMPMLPLMEIKYMALDM